MQLWPLRQTIDVTKYICKLCSSSKWNAVAFVIVRDMAGEESLGMCVFLVMILVFHVDDLVWGQSCHCLVSFCVVDAVLHILCSIPMIEHPVFMVYVQASGILY